MKTNIEKKDGKTIVTLEGELDTMAANEVENALKPLMESQGEEIIIECKGLEYIASSGLRILLSILKNVMATGGSITLRNVNDDIKNVFNLTGFVKLFKFE
ncbi:MAG: STAS domain-containing protein [Alloprevotella sp.]|uniref:STAS domain-containing protein n=1 Tax=Prevotella sp. Rep29 TaxID=2691580 RepID=UPI001C6F4D89|nr:STAS domain-containing protein [Prevotella sp. Rep29]MBQ6063117.1 STAS domain-containing protein [Prevotella sp.]MBQ6208807.1 STAS domain-containing protein [Prevotella sp.]MBR1387201.1 STAS domain-containing protein [Alloprevotella sp.]QYR11381.1 anti-sigma factor antagonist [Prevotella sp. Rep29]